MKRRLIKQAKNTLTISLPQQWTKRNKLEAGDRELTQSNKLKEDLSKRDDELRKENAAKENLQAELENTESRLVKIQAEQKSLQDVHNGLKEQYADLERQIDALNQSLALEKTLTERLKEEHSKPR